MSKQAEAFLAGEGEAWLKRNENRYDEKTDPVLYALRHYGINPKHVLEIGCADGSRLAAMERQYKCHAEGYDPCYETRRGQSKAQVWSGTADDLRYHSLDQNQFDMVIYGWCLYLCDPDDYFQIAAEGDRVLKENGFLIVYDFDSRGPYKVPYGHKEGLFSHHFDFSKLWSNHPAYSVYGCTIQHNEHVNQSTRVTILKKGMKKAFPVLKLR